MSQVDRQQAALYAIKNSEGTPYWEGGVKPFLSHCIDEVDSEYWVSEMGTPNPSYSDILELIMFKEYRDNNQALDFTLPENVTAYVIRVSFNEDDEVADIITVPN